MENPEAEYSPEFMEAVRKLLDLLPLGSDVRLLTMEGGRLATGQVNGQHFALAHTRLGERLLVSNLGTRRNGE